MMAADKKVIAVEENLTKPLEAKGYSDMAAIITDLEGLRSTRHIMIHGFHHIHEGHRLITRVAAGKDDVIAEEVNLGEITSCAGKINAKVRELNGLRRKRFHPVKADTTQKKVV